MQMNGNLSVANGGQIHMHEDEGGMDFNVVTAKVRIPATLTLRGDLSGFPSVL